MRNEETTKHNRQITILTIILIFIGIIILALAGVVIYNAVQKNQASVPSDSEQSQTEEYPHDESEIYRGAQAIYADNPENAPLVAEYYADLVKEKSSDPSIVYIYYIEMRMFMSDYSFSDANKAQFLANIDWSPLGASMEYEIYSDIALFAQNGGNTELYSEYAVLAASKKAAHDERVANAIRIAGEDVTSPDDVVFETEGEE